MPKYVIIAYLTQVKGYHFPYDIYLCNNKNVMLFNLERVKHLIRVNKYYTYEVYIEENN